MSAHDETEKVLRQIHLLLSKSEPYSKDPKKIVVEKQQVLDLLADLNKSSDDCNYYINLNFILKEVHNNGKCYDKGLYRTFCS